MSSAPGEITALLAGLQQGNPEARAKLMPLVYDQLRRLAARQFEREQPNHTLQPTALVHEAYLKLVQPAPVRLKNRGHFYRIAARAMRQVLVDYARARNAEKRGRGQVIVELNEELISPEHPQQFLQLDDALTRLERFAPRQAEIVELRYFAGLSVSETSKALGVGITTVKGDWRLAKAWLRRELEEL
jgi:RNA polymerase sigma factor (TIGR02999 family)